MPRLMTKLGVCVFHLVGGRVGVEMLGLVSHHHRVPHFVPRPVPPALKVFLRSRVSREKSAGQLQAAAEVEAEAEAEEEE